MYWVEPVEPLGLNNGIEWNKEHGWSTARLNSINKVRKMIRRYPNTHFRVEKIFIIKNQRWHYPIYTLKQNGNKVRRMPELWFKDLYK